MKRRLLLLLITSCLTISASGCLTLGPTTQVKYVLVTPGTPFIALENRRVLGRPITGEDEPQPFDVGGWVFMPREHFEALKRAVEDP